MRGLSAGLLGRLGAGFLGRLGSRVTASGNNRLSPSREGFGELNDQRVLNPSPVTIEKLALRKSPVVVRFELMPNAGLAGSETLKYPRVSKVLQETLVGLSSDKSGTV